MKALTAIIKLTLRNAIRSHVFQLLLLFLLLFVALVPTTVGGGTAADFIRVSLLYSLSGIGAILSISALWVGCQVMSSDIDSYQLHMVVSKPVSRVTIWFGKYLGVLILHLILLALAAAAVYGVVLWRFKHGDFPEEERRRIENEVLVGRRVFLPVKTIYTPKKTIDNSKSGPETITIEFSEIEKLARERMIQKLGKSGKSMSQQEQDRLYKECLKEVIRDASEVEAGGQREWVFENVPADAERALYLRFRPYINKVKSEDQRETTVGISFEIPRSALNAERKQDDVGGEDRFMFPVSKLDLMAGKFQEFPPLRGDSGIVSPKGEVRVGLTNLDDDYVFRVNQKREAAGLEPLKDKDVKHYYQPTDGPMLLVKITGFLGNYSRAILVLALQLAMMAAISCALGGFLTLPTAVFVSTSYLIFGFMATFMTDTEFYVSDAMDRAGQGISQYILNVVVPLSRFDVTDLIADGKLVEWSLIWNITWTCLLLRTLPLVLIGIYFYRRREIGLVIRK